MKKRRQTCCAEKHCERGGMKFKFLIETLKNYPGCALRVLFAKGVGHVGSDGDVSNPGTTDDSSVGFGNPMFIQIRAWAKTKKNVASGDYRGGLIFWGPPAATVTK